MVHASFWDFCVFEAPCTAAVQRKQIQYQIPSRFLDHFKISSQNLFRMKQLCPLRSNNRVVAFFCESFSESFYCDVKIIIKWCIFHARQRWLFFDIQDRWVDWEMKSSSVPYYCCVPIKLYRTVKTRLPYYATLQKPNGGHRRSQFLMGFNDFSVVEKLRFGIFQRY